MDSGHVWQEMRQHFSEMAETLDNAMRRLPPFSMVSRPGYPPVNVYRTDEEVIVRADVPGVPQESLLLNLMERALVIEGREDRSRFEDYECLCAERGPGEFRREVPLPEGVDAEAQPVASLEGGVLTVRLPRRPIQRGRTVHVKVAGAGGPPEPPDQPVEPVEPAPPRRPVPETGESHGQ